MPIRSQRWHSKAGMSPQLCHAAPVNHVHLGPAACFEGKGWPRRCRDGGCRAKTAVVVPFTQTRTVARLSSPTGGSWEKSPVMTTSMPPKYGMGCGIGSREGR